MKYLMLAVVLFSACKSKSDTLLSEGEAYLKSHLKDPASYAVIEKKIVDTVFEGSQAKVSLQVDSLTLELISDTVKYSEEIKELKEKIKNHRKELAIKAGIISSIKMHFTYRAKNSMGALDMFETNVRFLPSNNTESASRFEIDDL